MARIRTDQISGVNSEAWTSFTPVFSGFTVGSAVITGLYKQIGKTVWFRLTIILGAGSAVTGNFTFTLPNSQATYAGATTSHIIGTARLIDTGTASSVGVCAIGNNTSIASVFVSTASGTYVGTAALSSTVPHTWASTDEIEVDGMYEAA